LPHLGAPLHGQVDAARVLVVRSHYPRVAVTDWQLPAGEAAENATSAAVAASLRVEADAIQVQIQALEISRWSCITRAAAIERALRGIA